MGGLTLSSSLLFSCAAGCGSGTHQMVPETKDAPFSPLKRGRPINRRHGSHVAHQFVDVFVGSVSCHVIDILFDVPILGDNPRFQHTFLDEDFNGRVTTMAERCKTAHNMADDFAVPYVVFRACWPSILAGATLVTSIWGLLCCAGTLQNLAACGRMIWCEGGGAH